MSAAIGGTIGVDSSGGDGALLDEDFVDDDLVAAGTGGAEGVAVGKAGVAVEDGVAAGAG